MFCYYCRRGLHGLCSTRIAAGGRCTCTHGAARRARRTRARAEPEAEPEAEPVEG